MDHRFVLLAPFDSANRRHPTPSIHTTLRTGETLREPPAAPSTDAEAAPRRRRRPVGPTSPASACSPSARATLLVKMAVALLVSVCAVWWVRERVNRAKHVSHSVPRQREGRRRRLFD